ncbi:TPA: hypothetical protein ACH3X1_008640 [Trebouxia sp. C0004]
MEADSMQISNAASTSSQPAVVSPRKLTSFKDGVKTTAAKTTAAQKLRFSTLLCVAFITCGWSFRTVEDPEFIEFIQNLRPNYELSSQCSNAELPRTEDLTEHLQDMSTFSPSEEVELASTG